MYFCYMWLFEYFFHNSANLTYQGTDISKYLIESLGIRVIESRLYLNKHVFVMPSLHLIAYATGMLLKAMQLVCL